MTVLPTGEVVRDPYCRVYLGQADLHAPDMSLVSRLRNLSDQHIENRAVRARSRLLDPRLV